MHSWLSSRLATLLIDRADGHRRKVLAAFHRSIEADHEAAPTRRLRQVQRLADLLRHAAATVPFYREKLPGPAGITTDNAFDLWQRLPVIRRAQLQADPEAFRSSEAGASVPDATGGSSGTPMRFWVDRATQQARESSLYWSDSLAGWRYGERIAMLWGSDKDVKSAGQEARARLRWWIDNRRWSNAFNMGEEQMVEFHRMMARFRPHLVVAYAGSMEVYARFLASQHIVPDYPLRSIVCSAEVLTPKAREIIERVFRKPVFNRYGNREFGAIAAECPEHHGLHLNTNDCLVEVASPDPRSIPGNLVVTYLHNRAMPFLRYDTGDLATMLDSGACRCGRTSPRIAGLAGRESDTIRTAHGKLIHGEFFTHLLYGAHNVREFQFVQEALNRYELRLVANGRASPETEARWRAMILEEVGADARFDIVYVDHIPVLPSGKRKFTLSRIA